MEKIKVEIWTRTRTSVAPLVSASISGKILQPLAVEIERSDKPLCLGDDIEAKITNGINDDELDLLHRHPKVKIVDTHENQLCSSGWWTGVRLFIEISEIASFFDDYARQAADVIAGALNATVLENK